ncbi:jg945, partial [Pararge aegeria aegeria]
VSSLKQQLSDYEDKYKRALADNENVRRRMLKQVEDAKSFAIQSFCKDLLDVADTLAAAAESVPEGVGGEGAPAALRSLRDGLKLTRAQLTQEVEGAEPGTVVAVSKVGYKLHERCVRPALVGVAKGSS